MAYTATVMSGAELTLFNAGNKPALGANASWRPNDVQFRTGGSWAAGSDGTDASYPARRVYDGKWHLAAKAASAQTTWYLIFDFSSHPITFDAVVFGGHCATGPTDHGNESIVGVTVTMEIADDNAYSVNKIDVSGAGGVASGAARRLWYNLYHTGTTPYRYSNVSYARIKMTKGAAFTPQFGEVSFVRRWMLEAFPAIPFAPLGYDLESSVDDYVSRNGVISRNGLARGKKAWTARMNPWQSPYTSNVRDWFLATGSGGRPFWWFDTVNGNYDFALMALDPKLSMPNVGYAEKDVTLTAVEQGPEAYYHSQEILS